MSDFTTLRDLRIITPDSHVVGRFTGPCRSCGQEVTATDIFDGTEPAPACSSGCSIEQILAAHAEHLKGAAARDLAGELTAFYGLPSPIVRVKIWGRHKGAPADIHLKDGTIVRIDPVGDLTKPRETVQTLIPYGARFAEQPKGAALMQRFGDLYSLAEVDESDSLTSECDEWLQRFLRAAGGLVHDWDLLDGAQRYAAVGFLQDGRYDPQGSTIPAIVRDVGDYGPDHTPELLIRSSDLRLYIERVIGERITAQKLKARMNQAGYQHRVQEAWLPGADRKVYVKRKCAVFVLDPSAVPVSPESPKERTHAHAHDVQHGDTRDSGTEQVPEVAAA